MEKKHCQALLKAKYCPQVAEYHARKKTRDLHL